MGGGRGRGYVPCRWRAMIYKQQAIPGDALVKYVYVKVIQCNLFHVIIIPAYERQACDARFKTLDSHSAIKINQR